MEVYINTIANNFQKTILEHTSSWQSLEEMVEAGKIYVLASEPPQEPEKPKTPQPDQLSLF